MIIKGSDFTPAPEGMFPAVCVDVADLGVVESAFGRKHRLKVVWEIDQKMEDGRPFIVQKFYTASLHEKSTLAKDLKSWRGRAFTPDELKAFDMEKIIGVPCQLVITHAEKEGGIYANVQTILKAGPVRPAASGGYTRVKDRQANDRAGNGVRPAGGQEPEGIPF